MNTKDNTENRTRATKAGRVLDNYSPDHENELRDLLTDLMHYAAHTQFDFEYELDIARIHFEAETAEENQWIENDMASRGDL